jgi:hypothetical protein
MMSDGVTPKGSSLISKKRHTTIPPMVMGARLNLRSLLTMETCRLWRRSCEIFSRGREHYLTEECLSVWLDQ